MSEITGHGLFYVKKYIVDKHPDIWKEIVENGTDKFRELLDKPIIADYEYPVKLYQYMLQYFLDHTAEENFIKLSEYVAKKQFLGIFGLIARFTPLDKLISKGAGFWRKVFTGGKFESHEDKPGLVHVKISNFEINQGQRMLLHHYIRVFAEQGLKKKCTARSRIIDKTTSEFFAESTGEDL